MRRAGFTLLELLCVVTIIGILAGLAAPRLSGMLARERTRAALNRFTADFHYARLAAIRSGSSVEVRLTNSGRCIQSGRTIAADGWAVLQRRDGQVLRRVTGGDLDGVCLVSNNDADIVLNSRGLLAPFENRTVRALRDDSADTVTLNVLGRVYRRF